jgi:hypothetical protein
MIDQRVQESAALVLIGDSILAALQPERHVRLWSSGPTWWRTSMNAFAQHPGLTRAFGVAGAAIGIWWASRLRG